MRSRLLIAGIIVVIFGIIITSGGELRFDFLKQENSRQSSFGVRQVFAAGTQEAFNYLSTVKTPTSSFCGLRPVAVNAFSDGENIQGSCCGTMDFHRYKEQVEGLRAYENMPQIPEDPYNMPVKLARELFGYQKSIGLTAEEQKIYDKAMKMSNEGGPCCCQCWRWTAFEGQAKYLITEHNFTAEQIAEVWDLEDGCGGSGHIDHVE